ncbi:hypothetical protein FACS1894195_4290 [Bacteroidia bacterium]|nr:hypothetical protein FACS1894195_4290 [Bacteroidia bacterium]
MSTLSSCEKDDKNEKGEDLEGIVLALTDEYDSKTTIAFTSPTEFAGFRDGESVSGVYTCVASNLTLLFSDGTVIKLKKNDGEFTSNTYTVSDTTNNNTNNSGSFDGKIQAKVPAWGVEVDEVRAIIDDDVQSVVATGAYVDGGFTLSLPATVDVAYLKSLPFSMIEGLNVSNKNVKGFTASMVAYNKGSVVGNFQHVVSGANGTQSGGIFMYVDSDVTISGGYSDITYKLSLEKGWNKCYVTATERGYESYSIVLTTTEPKGVVNWFFSGSDYPACPDCPIEPVEPVDPNDGFGSFENNRIVVATASTGRVGVDVIDVIKAIFTYGENDEYEYEVATGTYADGGFTIDLPVTVNAKYLTSLSKGLTADVKFSDASVVGTGFGELWAYKDGEKVGFFNYALPIDRSESGVTGAFMYVDSDVTISGSYSKDEDGLTITEVYDNITLKKGWNELYIQWALSASDMTLTVSGTTTNHWGRLKWTFQPWQGEGNSKILFGTRSKRADIVAKPIAKPRLSILH